MLVEGVCGACVCECEWVGWGGGGEMGRTHSASRRRLLQRLSERRRALASPLTSSGNLESDSRAELKRLNEMKQAWTQRAHQSSILWAGGLKQPSNSKQLLLGIHF